MTSVFLETPKRLVDVEIDGQPVRVPEGATVLDDTVSVPALLRRITRFFRDESCGQCVPCRVGTVRQEELVARLAGGAPIGSVATELELLSDIGHVTRDASICGLGQTALSAVQSAVKLGLIDTDPQGV